MYISSPARLVFAQTSLCVLLAPKVPSAKTHKILLISPKMKSKIQRMVLLGLKLSDISCVFLQTLYSSREDVFPLYMSFVCTLPPIFFSVWFFVPLHSVQNSEVPEISCVSS